MPKPLPQRSPWRGLPLFVIADDSDFAARDFVTFLWTTFSRSNPSHDIHGAGSFVRHKHWGCSGPLIIDARTKPFHAPPLVNDSEVEKRVDLLGKKGQALLRDHLISVGFLPDHK